MGEGISFREALEVRLNILKPSKSQVNINLVDEWSIKIDNSFQIKV